MPPITTAARDKVRSPTAKPSMKHKEQMRRGTRRKVQSEYHLRLWMRKPQAQRRWHQTSVSKTGVAQHRTGATAVQGGASKTISTANSTG